MNHFSKNYTRMQTINLIFYAVRNAAHTRNDGIKKWDAVSLSHNENLLDNIFYENTINCIPMQMSNNENIADYVINNLDGIFIGNDLIEWDMDQLSNNTGMAEYIITSNLFAWNGFPSEYYEPKPNYFALYKNANKQN